MTVNTEALVVMVEANQNSSKITHIVDENGLVTIPKNNKPRHIVVDFEEYEAIKGIRETREKKLEMAADALIEGNMEALLESAK